MLYSGFLCSAQTSPRHLTCLSSSLVSMSRVMIVTRLYVSMCLVVPRCVVVGRAWAVPRAAAPPPQTPPPHASHSYDHPACSSPHTGSYTTHRQRWGVPREHTQREGTLSPRSIVLASLLPSYTLLPLSFLPPYTSLLTPPPSPCCAAVVVMAVVWACRVVCARASSASGACPVPRAYGGSRRQW